MAIHLRTFNALTGGAAGALDSLASGVFTDGDISRVITATGIYFYAYDLTSGAAESSPSVIAPDTLSAGATDGRHLLMFKLIPMDGTQDVEAAVDFTVGILIDGPKVLSGTGSPEGVVTAAVGSVYLRKDGGVGTTVYTKASGVGNTGWSALTVYSDEYVSGNATFTGDVEVGGSLNVVNSLLMSSVDITAHLSKLAAITSSAAELSEPAGQGAVAADYAKLHAILSSASELSELHSQGAVAADFAKLHAITKTAAQIDQNAPTNAAMYDSNGTSRTLVLAGTQLAVIIVGNVVAGDIFLVTAAFHGLKGATAGKTAIRIHHNGTAVMAQDNNFSHSAWDGASNYLSKSISGLFVVTTSGTSTIYLYGFSEGSNATVDALNAEMQAVFLRKL